MRENDKSFFRKSYQTKISIQKAGRKFQELKAQIREI